MTHELKILPKWFEDVKSGEKTFEIRRADRDFKVGDNLVLKEYEKGRYTGREIERTIQYIYKGDGTYGLSEDFWILGLKTKVEIDIIDELEKMKEEIEYYRRNHNCGVLECLDIIDKYIKAAWQNRRRKGEIE